MKNLFIKLLVIIVLLTGSAFAWGFKSEEEDDEVSQGTTQVAAEHILVKTAAEAVRIKKEIDDGGSFEYYAMKYSICPSGQNGGYLGYFERGQMAPEFEKKAFSMNIGEVSSPVKTEFGWHLIKIVDKR